MIQSDIAAPFFYLCTPVEIMYRNTLRSRSQPSILFTILMNVLLARVGLTTEIMPEREHTVSGFLGESAVLPCDVDMVSCGRIYFITWSKNVSGAWKREFLYSEGVREAMGDFAGGRARFHVANHSAELRLDGLTVNDEGTYKCDVTYVQGKCPSLSFIHLYTLIAPEEPFLEIEGKRVANGSTVGPYKEGSTFTMDCRSRGGRPPPKIRWRNGTRDLPNKVSESPEPGGTFAVTATTRWVLSRWDLGARLECIVTSNATRRPQVQWARLDVHVRPLTLNVRGPVTPVVAGEMVSLTCTVGGARPAANTTWYNRTEVLVPQPTSTKDLMSDGTFRTTSTLVFVASRHDHLGEFFCKGTNEVLAKRLEAALLKATTLKVLYPPAVTIEPEGISTVQEGGTANISCLYRANPREVTEIAWYRDGLRLQTPSPLSLRGLRPPMLHLVNISRHDTGHYTCHVRNAFGRGNSTNHAYLNVLYPLSVSITISHSVVSEGEAVNLECIILDGNPKEFKAVRWYHTEEDTYKDGLDPVSETAFPTLRLEAAFKRDGGRYRCEGLNEAGWSELSSPIDLQVKYSPGQSVLSQREPVAVKGLQTILECSIQDPGYPPATSFIWTHSGHTIANVSGPQFTIPSVRVDSQGNYSCSAVNEVGTGPGGFYLLNAVAPPNLVKDLPPSGGVSRGSAKAELSCRVECDPPCEVEWLRNNETLGDEEDFRILTRQHPEDIETNTFASITSTLWWSMEPSPSAFDHNTFTCRSSSNDFGPGVQSTTLFRVEYPPENVKVSRATVEVAEGESLSPVECTAHAHPRGEYTWLHESGARPMVAQGPVLKFNSSLSRHMAGNYTCVVANRHGAARAQVLLSVLHRPECLVVKEPTSEGRVHLTCIVYANPPIYDLTWRKNNVSIRSPRLSPVLVLDSGDAADGRYSCVATNELGSSDPCYLELSPIPAPSGWVQILFQEENLLIFAAIVGGVGVLLVLIIILVIAVVMKRRYKATTKGKLDGMPNPEGRAMVGGDGTPLGASPLLSGIRGDGGPLLQKTIPDLDCGYIPRLYGEKRPLNLLNGREDIG